jgi:hypothetical protein
MTVGFLTTIVQPPSPPPARVPAPPAEIKIPEFKAPDVKLEIPDFKVPDFKVPDFKAPDVKFPSFSMPKIDLPDMPTTSGAPAFSTPKFDIPKVSSVSMPKLDLRMDEDEDIEPQEIRDERAKEARTAFKEVDEKAKVRSLILLAIII